MTEISYLFSLWGIDEKPHPRRSFIWFGFFLFGLNRYSTCQMCFGYVGLSNKVSPPASASAGIWCLICCKRSSTRVTLLVKASSSCVRKSMCRRPLGLCEEWSACNPCACFHILANVEKDLVSLYYISICSIMLDVPKFHKLFRFYKLTRIYLPSMWSLNNPIASWTPSTPSLEVTFDSYLYKTVQGNDPVGDLKLGWKTLSSLYKYNNQTLGLALGSILENLTFDRTILTCLSWLYVMVGTKARLEKAGFLHRPL